MSVNHHATAAFKLLLSDVLTHADTDQDIELPIGLQNDAMQHFQEQLALHEDMASHEVAMKVIREWLSSRLPDEHIMDLSESTLEMITDRFLEYEEERTHPTRPRHFSIRISNALKGRQVDYEDSEEDENEKSKESDMSDGNDAGGEGGAAYESDGDYHQESTAGPSSAVDRRAKVDCPVKTCKARNMHPLSLKTHVLRKHPDDFSTHYPNAKVKYFPCAEPGCNMLTKNVKSGALDDHLSQAHGIDKARRLGTNERTYLRRKFTDTLVKHIQEDGGILNDLKDRLDAAEARLRSCKPPGQYQSDHGLDLGTRWPTSDNGIRSMGGREDLITALCDLRTEMGYDNGVKIGLDAKWGAVAQRLEAEARAAAEEARVAEEAACTESEED